MQVIEDHLQAACSQTSLEARSTAPAQDHQPLAKKQTRQQVIKQILHNQNEQGAGQQQHQLEETTGYLRCCKCGANIHKRSNEQIFQDFVKGPCLDQPYEASHEGHSTHVLWQKGNRVNCTECGLNLHLDAQQRLILTTAFKKPCKGAGTTGSPPLEEYFRKLATQASSSSPDTSSDQGSGSQQQTAASDRHSATRLPRRNMAAVPHQDARPTPRRLHFTTLLDQRDQGTLAPQTTPAMTPSLPGPWTSSTHHSMANQGGSGDEEAATGTFTVDYF